MKLSSRITVPPKTFERKGRGRLTLGVSGKALCRIEDLVPELPLAKEGEKLIAQRFRDLTGDAPKSSGETVIRLKIGKAPAGMINADQGYSLTVSKEGVTLCGFGEAGLLYACVTLCELLACDAGEIALPYLEIVDWPDIKRRGCFIESRYAGDSMELSDYKAIIDDMVRKKQNILTLSLYGCWQVQFDGAVAEHVYYKFKKYPKLKTPVNVKYYSPKRGAWIDEVTYPPIYKKNFFFELAEYGKRFGIEVVPMINSYGHNTHIPAQYPETSARFPDGTPTLNGFCTSSKATYDLLFGLYDDLIDNVLKPLGIESFDIGLDEVGDGDASCGKNAADPYTVRPAFCRCKKCEGKSPIERYIAHAIKLAAYLKGRGMKSVYLYSDMLFRKGRPAEEDYLPLFEREIEKAGLKDVVVVNHWAYADREAGLSLTRESLKETSLRAMIKPMNGYYHWSVVRHSCVNGLLMADYAHDCGAEAFSTYCEWDKSYDRVHALNAGFSWNMAAAPTVPDGTRRYAERLFPGRAHDAVRAFTLFDTLGAVMKREGELSARTLTENYLAYYFYSYFKRDTAYPQNYPGGALKKILDRRAEAEPLLKKINRTAKKAAALFSDLSDDPACDMELARRYALEAERYGNLTADFLALLEMYDLNKKPTAKNLAKIKELAQERADGNKRLAFDIETVKEGYLLPSELRCVSIYMQEFKDLSDFLDRTPQSEVKLDFLNLMPIMSKRSLRLR